MGPDYIMMTRKVPIGILGIPKIPIRVRRAITITTRIRTKVKAPTPKARNLQHPLGNIKICTRKK
jgi:hypothetical protein